MVHNIRVKRVDTNKQREEIERLQRLNDSLHKDIKIVKIGWSVKTIKDKKTFSSFLIEIEIAEMANQMLVEGFVIDYELKHYERFVRSRPIQCYNCQEYGYQSK